MSDIVRDPARADHRVWHRAVVVILLLAVAMALLAWLSSSKQLSPTEASLVGTWGDPDYFSRKYNDHFTMQFLSDRSFLYARPPGSPPIRGTWAIRGDTLVMRYKGGTAVQNMAGLFTGASVSHWRIFRVDDQLLVRTDNGTILSYPRIPETDR